MYSMPNSGSVKSGSYDQYVNFFYRYNNSKKYSNMIIEFEASRFVSKLRFQLSCGSMRLNMLSRTYE